MPTLAQVSNAIGPAAIPIAQWLTSRRSLNNATNTITQGAGTAGRGLGMATDAAIRAQRDALARQGDIATGSVGRTDSATQAALDAQKAAAAKQQGLYQTTIDANKPYSEFGAKSIQQLQDLQTNPNSLTSDPGYKFGLDQGLQGQQRQASAAGTTGNGGQVKAATRYALDYASTKYQDAWNRLMQATGVGERANAANASAGVTLGNQSQVNANEIGDINRAGATADNATMGTLGTQTGTEANNEGNLGMQNAEDQAALTLGSAEATAKNQGLQGNNTNSTIDTIGNIAKTAVPTIAKAFGLGGAAAAGTVGAVAGPTAGLTAAGAQMSGTVGGLAAGGSAGGSGIVASLGSLATNPVTLAIAGGIGAALLAKHFIGQGRKAADKLTGSGGIQHGFEETLGQIDSEPGATEAQKWQWKEQAYEKLKTMAWDIAKKGGKDKLVVQQMFDTIAPLFGDSDPWKANPSFSGAAA